MANRGFPRNNNKNNNRNKPNNKVNNVTCVICGHPIIVLNDDIQFSINLHILQSHKSTDSIDQDIDRQLSRAKLGPNVQRSVQSNYTCPVCKENIKVFGNDVKRALELHAKKHQHFDTGARGDDQSSTSSGRSRNSNRKQNYVKNNNGTNYEGMNLLDNTFYKMPPGLKAHRGFVFENESREICCGLCNVKIDSMMQIADHLKTKSHEDTSILFIKSKLPYELQETMDYVSFYGSNLCCNLCRTKIDLSSVNLSETIVNIIVHNAGKQHVNNKGRSEPLNRSKEGLKKLNFLASKDSLINNNKHVVSFEMQPQFKCTICDKFIIFDQNDEILLKNFTSHFSSNGHSKCARATLVLSTFKSTYQPKDGKHNLIVTKGSIKCTVCNVPLEASLEILSAHIKGTDSFTKIDWPEDLSARINKLDFKGPQQSFNLREQSNENMDNNMSKVNALLKSPPYRNVHYIVDNSEGQVICLICNCVIPPTAYNLETHLNGNTHKKNLSSTELGEAKQPNNSSIPTLTKPQSFNPFMKENSLPTMNAMSETKSGVDEVLDYLKRNDSLINRHAFLLMKHSDNLYYCKLCKSTIPKSHDVDALKENLITHLSGSNHSQLCADKQESELKKLMTVDPLIRANKNYLCKNEETLLCTLCDIQLTISMDGTKLKKSLTEHLKGQQHLSKMSEMTTNQETQRNQETLKTEYNFSKASESANNTTKSSNMFQIPFEQFKGPQNLKKSEEKIDSPQKPSFLLPIPTELLKEQSTTVKPKELHLEPPKPNSFSTEMIMGLFLNLPPDFQSDIAFIKKSSAVDGFLACTLCNTNHINPPYLQKHLEEEKHIQGKVARRPPVVQGDIQNSTSSKKMMQNMKNFFGLSN